jgi:hypothetical protein
VLHKLGKKKKKDDTFLLTANWRVMNEQVAAHASTQRQLFIFLPSTIPPRSHCCCCCCYFCYSLMLMILSFSLYCSLSSSSSFKTRTKTNTHALTGAAERNKTMFTDIQTVVHCFSQPPFPVFRLKLWAMSRCFYCTRTVRMRRALDPAMVVVSFLLFLFSDHLSF